MPAEIVKALNAIMRSASHVAKGGTNSFHGYKYTTETDVLEMFRPKMVEHGLVLIPNVVGATGPDEHGNTTVTMSYTLAHVSGEVWPERLHFMGCGNDRNKNGVGDKGLYKAITGANKYLLFKLFQIATGDDPESEAETTGSAVALVANGPAIAAVPLGPSTAGNPKIADAAGQTEDRTRVNYDLVVQTAETFLELCSTNAELNQYYKENSSVFEGLLKFYQPEKYQALLDKFKLKRTELTKDGK